MSLDWSIRNVRDVEEIMDGGLEANITQAIVFHTMAIDMGEITESNWQEFYARVAVMESHLKPTLTVPDLVEYNPLAVEPPEGTRYVEVNGTIYHYDGVDLDAWHDPTGRPHAALLLTEYKYNEGFGPQRGDSVTHFIKDDDTFAYHNGFKPRPITAHDVHRRIGLSTNVVTVSRAKWAKRMMDYWLDNGVKKADRELLTNAK